MKTLILVTVTTRAEVDLYVEHEPEEDPCDLTPRERERAIELAREPAVRRDVECEATLPREVA